jgi:hypothetical protein
MKKLSTLLLTLFILVSCSSDDDVSVPEASFLPMSIGNYWKYDDDTFTEITDTLRIQGNLYYTFTSVDYDTGLIRYLRMDENSQLIESHPLTPNKQSIVAKFNVEVGTEWWTDEDGEYPNKRTLVIKNDTRRAIYLQSYRNWDIDPSPRLIGYSVTEYFAGIGWRYPEVRIDGEVFYFD